MTLDLAKIKSDAEKVAANSDLLLMALPVKDVLGMLAEIECFDEGMRNIASFLGAGGYNDPNLSAAALVEKVSWGVGYVCDIHESQLNNLKAENEALRKDAERHRWLSKNPQYSLSVFLGKFRVSGSDEVLTDWYSSEEEAVDAAMAKEST